MLNNNEILFARVEQGQIIEFPVTAEQIRNRNAPLSMFKQVTALEARPSATQFQVVTEVLSLVGNDVRLVYKVTDLTLQEILNRLHEDFEKTATADITVADVPAEVFAKVLAVTRQRLGEQLNAFAQTRDYDDIVSLCSYATDPEPDHAAEGQHGVALRSQVWAAIRDYQKDVISGAKPVPRFESDIFEVVPALTWE